MLQKRLEPMWNTTRFKREEKLKITCLAKCVATSLTISIGTTRRLRSIMNLNARYRGRSLYCFLSSALLASLATPWLCWVSWEFYRQSRKEALILDYRFFFNLVVAANPMMRSTTNILIINLAAADLLFVIFCKFDKRWQEKLSCSDRIMIKFFAGVPFTGFDYVLASWYESIRFVNY